MLEWSGEIGLFMDGSLNASVWDEIEGSNGLNNSAGNFTSGQEEDWKPSRELLLCIGIYLTFVGLIATVGNILFIITATRWRLMRCNAHMILLLNLAICDLAISVVGYPYTTISGYLGSWPFGDLMCQLYGFLCFTFSQVSMNTLVCVSLFRYIAVCKPHKQHLLSSNSSWLAVGLSWSHALFWTVTPLLGWSSYTFEPTGISCSLDWQDRTTSGVSYTLCCIFFCYILHVSALLLCYRQIFSKVHGLGASQKWRERRDLVEQETGSPSPLARCESVVVFSFITENLSPLEIHVLRMNVIMVLTFIICWSPYAIVSLMSIFDESLSPTWYVLPTMFAKISCMMNPIVYGTTNRFLRKELLSVIRKCCGLTTPMENLQFMRQRQQEGLYNKEGIYTGGRSCFCTCDRCVGSRRQIFSNAGSGGILHREMIDMFIRQQRDKEAKEERQKKLLAAAKELRPTSLNLRLSVPNNGPISRSLIGRRQSQECQGGDTVSTGSIPGTTMEEISLMPITEINKFPPGATTLEQKEASSLDTLTEIQSQDVKLIKVHVMLSNSKAVTSV